MTNVYDPNEVRIVDGDLSGNVMKVTASGEGLVTGTFATTLEQIENSPTTKSVTVTTSATQLDATPLTDRKTIVIANTSDTVIAYIGGSGVTTANGFTLEPKEKQSLDMDDGAALYAIVASGTLDIRVMELN